MTTVDGKEKSEEDQNLIRLALHNSSVFTCLDSEQIERFLEEATLRVYKPGTVIIREGRYDDKHENHLAPRPNDEEEELFNASVDLAEADLDGWEDVPPPSYSNQLLEVTTDRSSNDDLHQANLYIIRSGNAEVWHQTPQREAFITNLGPGNMFGQGAVLFNRAHSATVRTSQMRASPEADLESDSLSKEMVECWVVPARTLRERVLRSKNIENRFAKYASKEDEMTMDEFVRSMAEKDGEEIDDEATWLRISNTFRILRKNDGLRIDLPDFCLYHLLMARPDPEIDITFLVMDRRRRGAINLDDFKAFLEAHTPDESGGMAARTDYFDMTSEFVERHFGSDGTHSIQYLSFPQFFADYQREIARQAFLHEIRSHGTSGGFLPADNFIRVLTTCCGWTLPSGMTNRLKTIYGSGPADNDELAAAASPHDGEKGIALRSTSGMQFRYSDFLAFQDVISQLQGISSLIQRACEVKGGPVSSDDLKVANRAIGFGDHLSRQQVDIIFRLFDLDENGFISADDTSSVLGKEFAPRLEAVAGRDGKLTFAPPPDFAVKKDTPPSKAAADHIIFEEQGMMFSARNVFARVSIGIAAAGIGATALFPLDLVKTRMMNQRIGIDEQRRIYKHSVDCIITVIKSERFVGLYRGLLPQLIGIFPEKAIKLTVNDMLRKVYIKEDAVSDGGSSTNLPVEVLTGATAGACQVLVSNPMELIKIRLQLQGERPIRTPGQAGSFTNKHLSSMMIVQQLGFNGLYLGARACLLRDIPFCAIYFPTYAACKDYLVDHNERAGGRIGASSGDIMISGTLAGIPAAMATSPADCIKTRLQVVPRNRNFAYEGVRDCAVKMYEQEGITAFFKGCIPRTLRTSFQFSITLLAYETLSGIFEIDGSAPPVNAPVNPVEYTGAFPIDSSIGNEGRQRIEGLFWRKYNE